MKRIKFLNVEKIVKDIKKLLLDTHEVKQIKDSYNYKGIDITHNKILCSNPTIKESFQKEVVDWMLIEHGRDMIDTIILKTFQLGYQQGLIESEIEKDKNKKLFLSLQKMENSLF